MQYTEENQERDKENNDIQEILEVKERMQRKITKYEEEIEFFKKNIAILDSILKKSSFSKASSLKMNNSSELPRSSSHSSDVEQVKSSNNTTGTPIRKSGEGQDGQILAYAHTKPNQLLIMIDDKVTLDANTPPFKSFFIDRIINGMIQKDNEEVRNGRLEKKDAMNYTIKQDGSKIIEIAFNNCRDNERSKEIINTISWSFTHMLKNAR